MDTVVEDRRARKRLANRFRFEIDRVSGVFTCVFSPRFPISATLSITINRPLNGLGDNPRQCQNHGNGDVFAPLAGDDTQFPAGIQRSRIDRAAAE